MVVKVTTPVIVSSKASTGPVAASLPKTLVVVTVGPAPGTTETAIHNPTWPKSNGPTPVDIYPVFG